MPESLQNLWLYVHKCNFQV